MPYKLPKDLYGGCQFNREFTPETLTANQIWRKTGPADALRIMAVKITGHISSPEYKGYMQGISVNATIIENNKVAWNRTFFINGDEAKIHGFFKHLKYSPIYPYPCIQDLPLEQQPMFTQWLMDQKKAQPCFDNNTEMVFYYPEYYTAWEHENNNKQITDTTQHVNNLSNVNTLRQTLVLWTFVTIISITTLTYAETAPEIAKRQQSFIQSLKNIDIDACIKPGAKCEQNLVMEIDKFTGKYMPLIFNHYKELIEAVFRTANKN